MRTSSFAYAIEDAIAHAMAKDPRVIIIGEDVHGIRANLLVRFGKERILTTPISESAFVGASVTAAMAGMRPIVEVMLVDYIGVTLDAIINHAAKNEFFSGGKWKVPIVIRTACGGGYGDAGQHEQSLWGWLAHIPGLSVVVPSTPADAGGLMLAAIEHDGPVVYFEHKLLSDYWLDWMGGSQRKGVDFNIPPNGARGSIPKKWSPVPIGNASVWREGTDLTMISVGVSVHRAMDAAAHLQEQGISAGVIDLRSVAPLDINTITREVAKTGRMLVVDEDYERFGLSGELAAVALESDIPIKYRRVCTQTTIPYARHLEDQTLPSTPRIITAAHELMII